MSGRPNCCKMVGIPGAETAREGLPASVLGRHVPAGDDRHGPVLQPALLIADEPTTALDVTTQAQMLELMKDLVQEFGASLVIVTHNLGVVARYAQRIYVMYAGRVVEEGPPRTSSPVPATPTPWGF